MRNSLKTAILGASVMTLAACTTTGNMERNAAIGAGVGAIAGAVIGNNVGEGDAETGAKIGAIVGGAGGAYTGHQQDQMQGVDTVMRQPAAGQQMTYDQAAGRYYFTDAATGRTYWQNGQIRS